MIIISGASGQLGHAIVSQLLLRHTATEIGVSVRDPDKVPDLAAQGVRVRQGDFSNPASLRHAFEGASQVLIVSSNARASGGDPVEQHRTAIDAAKQAGARRILYTSHMAASPASAFGPARDHAAAEELLRASGVPFTILRNGFYAAHAVGMMANAVKQGKMTAPSDGKMAWTGHADLAEAAAIILADEGRFDGPTPPLTGATALDLADLTVIASDLTGSNIERVEVSDDAFLAGFIARGAPESVGRMALGMFEASRNGEFATTDSTLAQLLGRPPLAMRDLMAAAFSR